MKIQTLFLSRFGSIVPPLIIGIAGIIAGFLIERTLVASRQAEEVAVATREVLAISDELKRKTIFHSMLAETLADAVALNPELDQQGFAKLVRPFIQTNPGIMNVAVAEDLVVLFVFPFEANKTVVGLDYARIPDQLASIRRMEASRSTVFSGPIDLVQGQRGYIHRAPVFVEASEFTSSLWGVVSVVTSEAELLSVAASVIDDRFDFAASRVIEEDATLELLWGTPSVLDANPVGETIRIGDQVWEISVAPRNGWSRVSQWSWLIACLTVVSIAVFCILVVSARQLLLSRVRSWEQLADAIEVIDDGFALYGNDDRLVMCNSKYKAFYGASAHLMHPGKTFEEIIRGGVANGQYADAVGNEEAWIEERLRRHANPDGPVEQLLDDGRWLKVYEAKMKDGSTVGFRVDVTELKEAKNAAEQASDAKTEFLNTVSHEVRTPLAAIIGYTSVLRNLCVTPPYRSLTKALEDNNTCGNVLKEFRALDSLVQTYARRIDVNGVHLLNIIDDILYWSNGHRIHASLDRTRIDIGQLLSSVKDQLSGSAVEAGIKLELSLPAGDASVLGDHVRLTQVFVNLVGNAIKFTRVGKVSMRVATENGGVRVTIEDTGPGIPEHEYENIFQSFTQLDHGDTREHEGCGLGLAISRDIVVRLGGEITVRSELGKGSEFTVVLPALSASPGHSVQVA